MPPDTPPSSDAVRLLFVGRLGDRRKGAQFLYEAYRKLIARGLPVELDVVGELGSAEPPPELPGLRYHGAVELEALAELYRGCDVFVAPSTGQESFGIVLLEAMASAKPIVCSDIEGYRQVVIPEGAVLVPPCDAAALEVALAEVVALEPEERAKRGAINRRVAESYSWDRIAEQVRGEYVAAIDEARARTEADARDDRAVDSPAAIHDALPQARAIPCRSCARGGRGTRACCSRCASCCASCRCCGRACPTTKRRTR